METRSIQTNWQSIPVLKVRLKSRDIFRAESPAGQSAGLQACVTQASTLRGMKGRSRTLNSLQSSDTTVAPLQRRLWLVSYWTRRRRNRHERPSQSKEHHKSVSFEDEFRISLKTYDVDYQQRYVWDSMDCGRPFRPRSAAIGLTQG
jgi:hypothetical protein